MKRKICALILALIIVICALPALAQMEVTADKSSVEDGGIVVVTLTVEGDKLSVAEGTYTYDASLLSFEEAAGGASDGRFAMYSAEKNGAKVLSATITFEAISDGEVKIDFALENLVDYDGKALDTSKASVSITITPAPAEPTPAPIIYSDASVGVKAENVSGASGDMFIWRSIENVTIPSRYSEVDTDYHGETVKGAQVKDSDAPTLMYLSDATGENAGYYIYDTARDMLYPYKTISSVSKSYIILEPDGSIAEPAGFTQTTVTIDEKEYKAWTSQDAQGEVFLLYARNPSGEVGYYFYNPADESMQRYAVLPARPVIQEQTPASPSAPIAPEATGTELTPADEPAPEAESGTITLPSILFFAVCGAGVIFLALFIFISVKTALERKRRRERIMERKRREAAAKKNING